MEPNGISPTDLPIPAIVVTSDKELADAADSESVDVLPVNESSSVTNSDTSLSVSHQNIREQLDKYSISENDEVTDDEVPHFPDHILHGIHPSPATAHHAAYLSDAHDESEEDWHTLDSEGLDLEAVGMDDGL
ncbi:hypothetical protein INT44_008310 [Umbelopsis vinacea]|uniref:Uncharacterized protein n=1 Tax=Umbelopsis vinacea TaxID=44442 RepID=A0A8H7PW78_9FUNG|nr:hypothetical protein INT44_008310 [Umbelopsis vinacea]